MKFVIQRVKNASVTVDNQLVDEINQGFLVFIGVSNSDNKEIADKMIKKLIGLRIFEDADGKTNLDIKAVNGELLLISQFTLYADASKGNRPSYVKALGSLQAEPLYEAFNEELRTYQVSVETWIFGADMKVSILNDGPVTIMLESMEKDAKK